VEIKIDDRVIGPGQPPYLVAELSANHNGSIECARRTIDAAIDAGADAIKLQSYTPDTMTIDSDLPDFVIAGGPWDKYRLYDLYRQAHTPFEWHRELFDYGRAQGITIFSTPFDETAVDLLEELETPAYKIASFELVDLPLIRYIASTGKPIILSTGMGNKSEIEEAVGTVRDAGCEELVLLHCVSSYPAPIEQANLRKISTLAEYFEIGIGLSDHTLGPTAAITAIALGACMVEKHFTISRQDQGLDSTFSVEPEEFKLLAEAVSGSWLSLGQDGFDRPEVELSSKKFRRSIYFVKDLPAGTVIGKDDIRRIRPGYGLAPKHWAELEGRELAVDVRKGTATSWEHLK